MNDFIIQIKYIINDILNGKCRIERNRLTFTKSRLLGVDQVALGILMNQGYEITLFKKDKAFSKIKNYAESLYEYHLPNHNYIKEHPIKWENIKETTKEFIEKNPIILKYNLYDDLIGI